MLPRGVSEFLCVRRREAFPRCCRRPLYGAGGERRGGRTPALALRQALGLDALPNLDFGSLDSLPETTTQEDAIVTETA